MKLLLLLPLLVVPFLLPGDEATAEAAQESAAAPVRWLDDLGLATSLAAESDRPLMVVFR